MRKYALTLLCMPALLLSACGASSTARPYTDMHTVTAISAKVAAHYGETSPKIAGVAATLTDEFVPMNPVAPDGPFHKGSPLATHLSFSMLSDGSKVWYIRATDDQYLNTDTQVWLDPEIDITH